MANAILFGGLLSIDNFMLTDTDRKIFVYSVSAIFIVTGILGCIMNYKQDKKDCYANEFTCPKCGKHLYHWRRLMWGGMIVESPVKSGKCGHCGADLVMKDNV
jgi:hypothetical protein